MGLSPYEFLKVLARQNKFRDYNGETTHTELYTALRPLKINVP